MDFNIKLILVEEEGQRADKSGRCNIKIINKYGVPVEVFYKDPGARPKKVLGNGGKDKLEVGETFNISTYQGVSWGVKMQVGASAARFAFEVIKYNFKNNILTIYNTKMKCAGSESNARNVIFLLVYGVDTVKTRDDL